LEFCRSLVLGISADFINPITGDPLVAWGPFLALLLRALPEILFLFRRSAEHTDREKIHADVQEFRGALVEGRNVDLHRAADLLERRMREARALRSGRAQADAPR